MIAVARNRVSHLAVICVTLAAMVGVAGCTATGTSTRTDILTAGGAGVGAVIGARQGGVGGAIAGAIIGGGIGLVAGLILDEIERENMRQAQLAAARSGGTVTRSFRNKSGQRVSQRTQTLRTYDCGGSRCREISTATTRDGNAAGSETARFREVKTGGRTEWVAE